MFTNRGGNVIRRHYSRAGLSYRILLTATAAAVCAALVVVPSSPAAATVASELRRYPYLTDLVTTNVTINWATTTSLTTGTATYGRVGSESCTAHTVTATRTSMTIGSTAEYQWKAQVSGLTPDAAYCYRVFGGTTDLLGSDPSPQFRSQIAAGSTTPFSFAVFGDWGLSGTNGTNPDQANVMSQIAASGARFAVTTGDNGYSGGTQTDYGDIVQTGSGVSGIFGPNFWTVPGRSIPIFPTQGNHGMNSVGLTNWPQDRAVAASAGRYQMDTYCCVNGTTSESYPSAWYAFDAGKARFYVLEASWADGNVGTSNLYGNDAASHWTVSSPEYQWLSADLAAHPNQMKFAFFHFPLYSANGSEVSDTFLQGASPKLEGLLGDNGVDVVFNGHAHVYTRSNPSAAGMPVTYTTGGGGATLSSVSKCAAPVAAAIGWSPTSNHGSACGSLTAPATPDRVYHFLLVSVNGSNVTVTPTDELGRTFDVQTYTFGNGGAGDTQDPTPPTNLQATGSTGKVDLTWTAGTDDTGVTGYKVFRGGTQIDTIGAVTSYTDTNVTAGTTYTYTLQSLDAAGHNSVQSGQASATVPAAGDTQDPTPPTNLQATGSTGKGDLTWTAGTDDTGVTGYKVFRGGTQIDTIGAVTSYTDTNVTAGTTYTYTLQSLDAAGHNSVQSGQASATVPAAGDTQDPTPPTNLQATGSTGKGDLTWTAGTDDTGVTGYKVFRGGTQIDTIGAVTSYTDTNVTAGTTYTYTLQSLDAAGHNSVQSGQASATVPAAGDTQDPTPPTNLQATGSTGKVDLTWTAGTDDTGVTGYKVFRGGTQIGTTGGAQSYPHPNVTAGPPYTYPLQSLDAAGHNSVQSGQASATVPAAGDT